MPSDNQNIERCAWARVPEEISYHDAEWGVPVLEDRKQFEFLVLEAAQAGLSWLTILRRREGYSQCFAEFDPQTVARFTTADVERLMLDTRIIRNRKKIESTISNARIFLELQTKHGSFCNYIWNFVDGRVKHGNWEKMENLPAITPVSERISKEMKTLGFKFLGPTVIYAHMQATGMVNDHLRSCFRYEQVKELCKLYNV